MAVCKLFAAVFLLYLIVDTEFVQCTDHCESQLTYVQPQRFIKCPSPDEICDIQLTISSMLSLSAYTTSNGARGDTAYEVTVNEQGCFDFMTRDKPITETELFQPIVAEGTTRRNLLVINDQLPGPTLIGYKNQRVRINVTNNLGKEAITLHWHGQHVNGSAGQSNQYMDGVPYITQCPILPSNSFVYDFHLFPGGTYWYHSHQFDERSNGMYGGLIVLDPDSPQQSYQDIPEQHMIAFFEWFPVNSDEYIETPLNSLPDPVNASKPYEVVPTNDGTESSSVPFFAGFMNYAGWRYTPAASDCRRVANTILPYFNVSQGESYRFRIIGSQVTYAYRFSIHNHRLRVVATDGFDATVPNAIAPNGLVDYIIVHVGERYDFILEASQPVDNYLMLVETLEVPSVLMERGYCIKAHRVYSVLHYNGASDTLPSNFDDSYDPLARCSGQSTPCYALNCPFQNYPTELNIQCINVAQLGLSTPEPVPNNDVNPSAFLNFGFGRGPSVNDRRFEFPPSPPLSQLADIDPDLFCQYSTLQSIIQEGIPGTDGATSAPVVLQPPFTCVHTYTVDTDTVEMVYTDIGSSGGSAHPIHLHGHHYRVMNIGYPTYNEDGTFNSSTSDITCAPGGLCNLGVNWTSGSPPPSACEMSGTCPMKDTVIIPFGGYVRIRFPRNNWGWWIMHCHIEPHLLGGMAMVVNETSVPGDFPVPPEFPMCGNFNAPPNQPSTPSPQPLILPSEAESFKNATIALAVISIILLAALIATIIVIIVLCIKGKKGGPQKVEIELK